MPFYFLDSSALLKRYVAETGTAWVQSLFDPVLGNRTAIAAISIVEITAAVARRRRAQSVTPSDAAKILNSLRVHLTRDFELVEIAQPVIDAAAEVADRHALRGYDAVQLAAAMVLIPAVRAAGESVVFISADLELNAAALAEGLSVEDPNMHP